MGEGENVMTINEYTPGSGFNGVIGRTVEESSPAWPRPVRSREGMPNVLFVILDDVGFGQLGCYGAPIRAPRGVGNYTSMNGS